MFYGDNPVIGFNTNKIELIWFNLISEVQIPKAFFEMKSLFNTCLINMTNNLSPEQQSLIEINPLPILLSDRKKTDIFQDWIWLHWRIFCQMFDFSRI